MTTRASTSHRARWLVVVALLSIAIGSCARAADPNQGESGARATTLLPGDRLELPELGLEEFRMLLAELRGSPVVVNIWGSWCPPCQIEAPDLSRVAHELQGKVQFLGVDILDVRRAARDFILAFDWPYPSVFDPDGEIRDGLGYVGQPITIIYDRDGKVAFEWNGIITADLLRGEIAKVL